MANKTDGTPEEYPTNVGEQEDQAVGTLTELGQIIEQTQAREAEALAVLIGKIKPIMRLIDANINQSEWRRSNRNGGGYDDNTSYGRGIILDDSTERRGDTRGTITGDRLLLMRDGTLKKQVITGEYSQWQGDSTGWNSTITDISPQDVVREYYLEGVVRAISQELEKAVKNTETKRRQLQNRIGLCNRILEE